jgi:MoaA/NifB/PqqE/SkfB family radical SAM enzyme
MIPRYAYRFSRKEFLRGQICLAAERNVFVNATGEVTPCCFNRKTVYGNLFIDPFEEVMGSPIKKALQNSLRNNDFSMDCGFCKTAIDNRNFKAARSQEYDFLAFSPIRKPMFAEFELDTYCNLNCVMCPKELHGEKPSESIPDDFIVRLSPLLNNLRWAKFHGGEPFLIEPYFQIWNYLLENNPTCVIKIQTNGTVLDDRIKTMLNQGRFELSVSMDSLNAQRYNEIRSGASFAETFSNLEYFIQWSRQKKRKFNLAVCPMTINTIDIPELVMFCLKNKLYINFNIVTSPKHLSLMYLESSVIGEVIKQIKNLDVPVSGKVSRQISMHLKSLVHQLVFWQEEAEKRENRPIIELTPQKLADTLLKNIPDSRHPKLKDKVMEAIQYNGNVFKIRTDILDQLGFIPPESLESFLASSSEEEISRKISEVITYGF